MLRLPGSRSVTWEKVITCIIMLVPDASLQNDGLSRFLSFSHFLFKQFRYKGVWTAKSSHLAHFHLIGTVFSVALLPLLMGNLTFH